MSARPALRARGIALAELMIAMALGLLVLLGAVSALLASSRSAAAQAQAANMDDAARFALAAIDRAARQSGYVDWDRADAANDPDPAGPPAVHGLDAASLAPAAHALNDPRPAAINGSDILALRFGGGGAGAGDGSVTTCAGWSVGAGQEGWSIFYVALSADGRPELRCKYRGANNWSADAVISGVDSFQVLYGVDTSAPADGVADSFFSASVINDMDGALVGAGATEAAQARDVRRRSWWHRVTSIKVALILRAEGAAVQDQGPRLLHAFGAAYSQARGDADTGTRLDRGAMDPAEQRRAHRVFSATIVLRNRAR